MQVSFNEVVNTVVSVGGISVSLSEDEIGDGENYTGDGRFPEQYRVKDRYEFVIGVDGRVRDWPEGVVVDGYFKPRDDGYYYILAPDGTRIREKDDCGYVPACLSMGEGGGDYIELKIDGFGNVAGFTKTFGPRTVGAYLTSVEES